MSPLDAFLLVLAIGMVGSLIGAYFNQGEVRQMFARAFLVCMGLVVLGFAGYLWMIVTSYNQVIDKAGSGLF